MTAVELPDPTVEVRADRPVLRAVGDAAVLWLARLAATGWFRRIEVVGLERLHSGPPVIVVANHSNGFVDPLTLMATTPRPLRFLAKATLWKVPGVKWLLAVAGVLPVERRQDGQGTDGNQAVFAASDVELANDGAVAIFPEGTVNDALRLKPLKTGAARIALGARQAGARSLRIVPVGLVYLDRTRPRSRVLVRAGEPIELDDAVKFLVAAGESEGPDNHDAVHRLTALMAARLAEAATDYDRSVELVRLLAAATVQVRGAHADPSRDIELQETEPIARALLNGPAGPRDDVLAAVERYDSHLVALGLRDVDVVPGNTTARFQHRSQITRAKVLALAPAACIGAGINGPSFGLVKAAAAVKGLKPIDTANFLVLASLVTFPLTWAGWGYLGRRAGLRHPWRLAFTAGPLTGQAAVLAWELLQDSRTARVQWRRTLHHSDVLADLRADRADVVEAVNTALAAATGVDVGAVDSR